MTDHDQRAREPVQVIFQPDQRRQIEVVRRLVQQHQVGIVEQQFGQRHTHLPAARELLHRPLEILFPETEARKYTRHLRFGVIPFQILPAVLQCAQFFNQLRIFGRDGQLRAHRLDLIVQMWQIRQPAPRLGEQLPAAVRNPVLRQIANGQVAPLFDGPRCRLKLVYHQLQDRRLARAVRAHQAVALAAENRPRDAIKQHASRQCDRELVQMKQPHDLLASATTRFAVCIRVPPFPSASR